LSKENTERERKENNFFLKREKKNKEGKMKKCYQTKPRHTDLFAKIFIFKNRKKKLIFHHIKTLSKLETKTSMSLVYEYFMYRIKKGHDRHIF
jgi:hypothetical protein